MADLARTPLHDRHVALGARMGPFAGYEMAIHYGSVVAEHRAVRSAAGVFDVSHLGRLLVDGPDAGAVVQASFSNDAAALAPGQAHYSLCLADDAGILDDLLVYRLSSAWLVVPNAANAAVVRARLEGMAATRGWQARVRAWDVALLAVQGRDAAQVLAEAGVGETAELAYLDVAERDDGSVVARSGYTGELGFEVFTAHPGSLWDTVVAAGATPAGLGARDTLRLEMGYPLHGNDIGPDRNPVEARLGWAVKPGTGFVGEDAYVAAREAGAVQRLWGLRTTRRGIPRPGCGVVQGTRALGTVTSGSFSPTLEVGIALAYLDAEVQEGFDVAVDVRGRSVPAVVTRPPFVDASPR